MRLSASNSNQNPEIHWQHQPKMSPLSVHIKHAGKVYDVQLDPDLPPSVFKDAIYHATGVPPDRMKVILKGGVLKVSLSERKKKLLRLRLLMVCIVG